jgi:ABC-2 type transport system permease protein
MAAVGGARGGPILTEAPAPKPRRFGARNWIGLFSLIRRELIREYKWLGMTVVGPALQSVLFAAVFTLAGAGEGRVGALTFLEFLGAGLIISAVIQRGFEVTGYSIMFDKLESDGLQDILGAPLSPGEILTAYLVTATVVAGLIGGIVWIVLLPLGLGAPAHPLAALGFGLIVAATFSMIGLIAAILSKKWDALSGKETFVIMPLVFLSGTFFPLSAVPEGAWRTAFEANPVFYLVDGFRWAATGQAETDPLLAAGVALALFATAFAIAARMVATGYKLKP